MIGIFCLYSKYLKAHGMYVLSVLKVSFDLESTFNVEHLLHMSEFRNYLMVLCTPIEIESVDLTLDDSVFLFLMI